jgi:hypothetical protein
MRDLQNQKPHSSSPLDLRKARKRVAQRLAGFMRQLPPKRARKRRQSNKRIDQGVYGDRSPVLNPRLLPPRNASLDSLHKRASRTDRTIAFEQKLPSTPCNCLCNRDHDEQTSRPNRPAIVRSVRTREVCSNVVFRAGHLHLHAKRRTSRGGPFVRRMESKRRKR